MNKTYNCSLCSKAFCKDKTRREHERKVHPNIPCNDCGLIFENPQKLNAHKKTKHTSKECQVCGKSIRNEVFKRHLRDMHGSGKMLQL